MFLVPSKGDHPTSHDNHVTMEGCGTTPPALALHSSANNCKKQHLQETRNRCLSYKPELKVLVPFHAGVWVPVPQLMDMEECIQ